MATAVKPPPIIAKLIPIIVVFEFLYVRLKASITIARDQYKLQADYCNIKTNFL